MRERAAAYPGDLPGPSPRLRAALRERPPPAVELGFMRYGALDAAAELALIVKGENGALRIPFPAVSAIACEKTDRSGVALPCGTSRRTSSPRRSGSSSAKERRFRPRTGAPWPSSAPKPPRGCGPRYARNTKAANQKQKAREGFPLGLIVGELNRANNNPGDVLLSHTATRAVPSAPKSLTSEFGMGSGVASSKSSPEIRG